MSTPAQDQARLDGQLAATRKARIAEDPHARGSAESWAWRRGWREVVEGVRV